MQLKTVVPFLFSLLTLSGCEDDKLKKVGIIQAVDHPALNSSRLGILEALVDSGFINGKTVKVAWESAQGNPALASQIVQKFMGQHADVIVTIGTMPSQVAVQTVHDTIPIIYASVTDPKAAKLTGNISGVSNYVDSDTQFQKFKQIMPNLKSIGVIYNPGEVNSEALVEPMKKSAAKYGLEVVFAVATKTSDIYTAAMSIANKVDALFVNNDNTALSAFDAVLKVGQETKKPAFVSDDDLVKNGAIAALGPNQRMIGVRAGKMVASLLKDPKLKASDIPEEGATKPLLHLNLKAAKAVGVVMSEVLLREAIHLVD